MSPGHLALTLEHNREFRLARLRGSRGSASGKHCCRPVVVVAVAVAVVIVVDRTRNTWTMITMIIIIIILQISRQFRSAALALSGSNPIRPNRPPNAISGLFCLIVEGKTLQRYNVTIEM